MKPYSSSVFVRAERDALQTNASSFAKAAPLSVRCSCSSTSSIDESISKILSASSN